MNLALNLDWIPVSGFRLRKAGVHFDAVRVDGDDGRRLADVMDRMTGGDPGPIVTEANGSRGVYFLLPAASTTHRSWPRGVTRYNSGSGSVGYVPVPALEGLTWPLAWRVPPVVDGRFVHPLLLRTAAVELLG
ncbi:hypothetical protein [Streptomyces pacificus]|uniref:DNA primase/polymerase bifunctional N-terminal domain-containing protein n=1 Tax=Streptomyces pacificus TaxID=2705029 RepID=A0A6A0B4Y9_9ACTN|nr:hypothetical protein [Streptomyces pacificus]GFH39581.1 hypothetical protein SCWH03_58490 [Streptomyces pacificus]